MQLPPPSPDVAVTPLDMQAAPHAQRLAIARMLAEAVAFAVPEDPPPPPEKEAIWLAQVGPDERTHHFVVWDGEQVEAWGMLGHNLTQNTHAAHARLVVRPDARRRGLGRAVTAALLDTARREGRRLVTFGTSSRAPAGEAYARTLGAESALPMRQSQLVLDAVDAELLRAWQVRPQDDPYRLRLWHEVPAGEEERAAELMMVMNTAPRGDLDVEDFRITPDMIRTWNAQLREAGEVRPLLVAEDTRTGRLDGYTEVYWLPERAALVFQGATAVRPAARGRGLGKWLKAAMTEHVRAHLPGARVIRTNNADTNAAMLGINVALGFQPWATFTEWQLRLDA